MRKAAFALILLQILLACLFIGWLILFITQPIHLTNDAEGYLTDAKSLFDPSYQTMRPVLFPFCLRVLSTLGLKLSVTAYLINAAGLLYFIRETSGKWFSLPNTLILIGYFLLTGIWSYCGTCLTESILLSVELWIFIFLTRMFFPKRTQAVWVTVVYALLICVLGITLKPWIMLMVILTGILLVLASLFLQAFRTKRLPACILLAVSVGSFALSLHYNRSKSAEVANIVMLMISSGNEGKLRDRLQNDKGLTPDSAAFIATLVSDIDVINQQYNGNAWKASTERAVKILNIWDKDDIPLIDKAFHLMYFDHTRDALGLVVLSVRRYLLDLRVGTVCLNMTYTPELPGLRTFGIPAFLVIFAGFAVYGFLRRGPPRLFTDPLAVFTAAILLASAAFCLFLSLAGANELERNVLPGVLFQLFALTYLLNTRVAAGSYA